MTVTSTRPPLRVLWRESHATSAVLAALVASVPAALVAALVMAAGDLLAGRSATAILGELGFARLFLGSAAFAAIWGVLVAFTAHHLASAAGALWGSLYGVAVWIVAFLLFLPFIDPALTAATPARVGILFHIAWGATLGALFHAVRLRERERHSHVGE